MLTADRLRELMIYDPSTGIFKWIKTNSNARGAGKVAGSYGASRGYRLIGIDGTRHLAHRLSWLYMTGDWPQKQIDHIDGVRDNNCWSNLRLATPSQNIANTRVRKENNSGLKGVCYVGLGRWRATIKRNGKSENLGTFGDPQDAYAAFCQASVKIYGNFARLDGGQATPVQSIGSFCLGALSLAG